MLPPTRGGSGASASSERGEKSQRLSDHDPQSAMTPIVQAIEPGQLDLRLQGGSNKMLDLRKEATLQGVTSVKVWGLHPGVLLSPGDFDEGGADVEGTREW